MVRIRGIIKECAARVAIEVLGVDENHHTLQVDSQKTKPRQPVLGGGGEDYLYRRLTSPISQ
jgi:hypothetical protein